MEKKKTQYDRTKEGKKWRLRAPSVSKKEGSLCVFLCDEDLILKHSGLK